MPRSGGGLHPLTQDYISRLQSAGGHLPQYDQANDYLIRELVKLGGPYWDTMGTLTTLCAKGFDALMVPLRDGMDVGTLFDFVEGDLHPAMGLKGNGSTKYLNSNRANDDDPQTSQSVGVWVSGGGAEVTCYAGTGGASSGATYLGVGAGGGQRVLTRSRSSAFYEDSTPAMDYHALSRATAGGYSIYQNGEVITVSQNSGTPLSGDVFVFARNNSGAQLHSSGRLALYHIGPGEGIDLETLGTIFTGFMARVYAASGLHPLTLDYISRLQAAGGHLPQYDKANDYLIRELSGLGGPYWDTMGTLTTLCAKGFDALMVPLRDGMDVGTSVNFVSGDFDSVTGLKGDGSTKYLNSNRDNDEDSINSQSFGAWATEMVTGTRALMGEGTASSSSTHIVGTSASTIFRQGGSQVDVDSAMYQSPGYIGLTRLDSMTLRTRIGGNTVELVKATSAQNNDPILVFARGTPGSLDVPNNGRYGLYHIGPGAGIDLETLDTIFTEFVARVAAAPMDPAFVMLIKTDHTGVSSSDQMLIPTSGTGYDFEINWGDGTTETLTDADIVFVGGVRGFLHTYPAAGEYTTRITGAFPRVYFNNAGDRLKVLSVHLGDGSFGWDNFVDSFHGCENNSSVTGFIPDGIDALLGAWRGNNLTEWNIQLPESLTSCAYAWEDNNLTEWNIPLPESLTSCAHAWRGNPLTEWNTSLPESLTRCDFAWFNTNLTSWTAGGSWKSITTANNAAAQANINTADYSALLELIAATATQSNVPLNFGASQYNAAGEVARNYLTNELNWTITDGGLAS